jgi:HK97 family phage portal protein
MRKKPHHFTEAEPALGGLNNSSLSVSAMRSASYASDSWTNVGAMAGQAVNPETAMTHTAVYRAVSLIAGAIAMIPCDTFVRAQTKGGRDVRKISNRPAASLLTDQPNLRMSRTVFWRQVVSQMLLRGNGVVWIERNRNGQPLALWPIPFERVITYLSEDGQRLRYQFWLDNSERILADQDDILHFPGSPQWMGLACKTPIRAMADAVGIGLEANAYARLYFQNDATPPGYISYEGILNSESQANEIRNYFASKFGGQNRHSGPAVLTNGGKFNQLILNAEDAQLLETRRFQIEDIARVFGVPRHLLGMDETSWGSGIEALSQGFVTFTLDPHLTAIQDEVNRKLYGNGPDYCEFNRDALVQTDLKSKNDSYRAALGGSAGPGWLTPNEIRRMQNLSPLPDPAADQLVDWTRGGNSSNPASVKPA